ncbi:MAG: efflux RND transporter permease subunit, partial [Gammaproteobacteria bacterium]|nr:efflux RND transporter permease subunit [Gammaproteobacteria bacterium]
PANPEKDGGSTTEGNFHKRDFLSLFAHHRVAANLLMVLIILTGLWSLSKLNTQFFPSFALDIVNVRTIWSGASAEDIERAITKPMEQELFTLNGLHRISSTSATNISAITLEFKEGTDIGIAMDEINQQLALFRQLPADAEAPEVSRVVRYENIARLIITHTDTLEDIRELGYRIRDDLLKSGISKIDITGLPEEEIAIEVSQNAIQQLNIPISVLGKKIQDASRDIPAGTVGREDVSRQIRGLNQQRSADGFGSLVISANEQGQKITLNDIATVRKQPRQNQVTLLHNGKPAVELRLRRTENSDALDSAKLLEQWINNNEATLPPGVKLQVYDESWKLIEDRIMVLLVNGLGGLALVVAILFIFLNGRVAFWVSAGIPVSFLATLSIMFLADSSINMISLFGLIMAVGIIVDDAIVVAEYSQDLYDNGDSPADAAEKGARRMLAPVASSSLTTIAAFLPLMIVGGVMGNIMFEIPLVIICVVIASLVECFLILPAHMRFTFSRASIKESSKKQEHAHKQPKKLRDTLDAGFNYFKQQMYTPVIKFALKYRSITIASAIAFFIISISLVAGGRIAFTFFPSTESKVINANVSFTAGTPASRVQAFLEDLEKNLYITEKQFLHQVHAENDSGGMVKSDGSNDLRSAGNNDKKIIEVVVLQLGISSSGGGTGSRKGEQYGSIFIEIISPDQRDFKIADFVEAWKANTVMPAGLELFTIAQRHGGPPGQDIDIRLSGNTPAELKKAAQELQQKLLSYPGVSAIEDDLPWGQEQLIY